MDIEQKTSEQLIGDKQFRKDYAISASTAYRLRMRRKNPIPYYRVGGCIRYKRSEIEAFFKQNGDVSAVA